MRASFVFLLGFAAAAIGAVRWIERQLGAGSEDAGEPSDEEVTARVRAEWQRLGLQTEDVSVTVDSGVAYLRGSSDAVTADTLRATASRLPGVRGVRDELTRRG
jgi:osmotically-inducible protein OsmY